MRKVNKTRYAILGALMEWSRSGYEIKALMERSTRFFWRESDSTLYPMLKVLAKEGKVISKETFVGKKRKEVFSITELGKEEFLAWLRGPTGEETPRSEFLLKLFFLKQPEEAKLLFRERLATLQEKVSALQAIEKRLKEQEDSAYKEVRLKALQYGLALLNFELEWLEKGV